MNNSNGFAPEVPNSTREAWKRSDSNITPHLPHTKESDKVLRDARDEGGYHWRNGIYFKRLEGGSVEVRHFVDWNYHSKCERWVIPASEWASIIAGVSAQGETSEKYQDGVRFHSEK